MKTLYLLLLFLLQFVALPGQNMRKLNREGVAAYEDSAYSKAELAFRKAFEADSNSMAAAYNIAGTLYKQEKYDDAGKLFEELSSTVEGKNYLSNIHHNLGNSFLKKQEYEKSIEAYKNALRLDPADDETRYNLAYAKAKLKQKQQQEQQQQQNQQQNKDQQDQKQEKDQQQQQKDQNKQQEQEQEQQQQQENQQDKKDQQQQQKAQAMKSLSKEDMERLLQAIQQQEKEVQMKLEKEKAKAPKTKTEKDW